MQIDSKTKTENFSDEDLNQAVNDEEEYSPTKDRLMQESAPAPQQ